MSDIPRELMDRVTASLEDTERPAYGQVATMDENGHAQVRTVHLRYIKEKATLGFSTHVLSPKWSHLLRKPALSGCYLDLHRQVQLRWEGPVELVEAGEAGKAEAVLLDRMWGLLRAEVRAAYWKDCSAGAKPASLDVRCPNLGFVICRPTLWDLFQMDPLDYTRGKRTLYILKRGTWQATPVSLIHSRPI